MYSSRVELDKFYTKPEVAESCINLVNFEGYDYIVEPSAGSGSFSDLIDDTRLIALDLLPEKDYIKKQDWFEFEGDLSNSICIGNPPFGNRNNLSKKFIKHGVSLNCKTIAFILPDVYHKHTLQKVFPKEYRLIEVLRLDKNSFIANGESYHVPCSFFIWDKSDGMEDLRFDPNKYTTEDFEFIPKSIATVDDFFILGASPNTTKEIHEVNKNNRGYYIRPKDKNKKELIEIFKKAKFIGLSSVNGGASWRTKPEIIKNYLDFTF